MKVYSVAVFCIWLTVAALGAQAPGVPPTQRQYGSLRGVVVKDPESVPLKKALIELIAESRTAGETHTAITGADGTFRMENIAAGRYRLYVERAGYQEIGANHRPSNGRLLTITVGQELKDLVMHLQASAVVQGRISDEDGDPLPEAQVAVMRQSYEAGRMHWEQAGAERTNDLGEFRIASLAAGKYFISITPPLDFRSLVESRGDGMPGPPQLESTGPLATSYQTTYYPGTRDRGQAMPILLHPGDEFPINFSLTPAPCLSIRGSVVGLPPGHTASVTLRAKDSQVVNVTEVRKEGSFEISNVAPGDYAIVAAAENASPPLMAGQSLTVAGTNVEGLRLALQPGGSIRGRLRLEGIGHPRPVPGQIFLVLRSGEDTLDAISADTSSGFSTLANVNLDGSFEWKNIPPGRYRVQILDASAMPDWFLKPAVLGGQDIIESGITVNGGPVLLDLIASDRGASVQGLAANATDEAVADAVIVAVPEVRFRSHPERYFKANADQSGRFTLRGLPPGEYTLFAWESLDGESYLNPDFLRTYQEEGTKLHLREGERTTVQLKAISASLDESEN